MTFYLTVGGPKGDGEGERGVADARGVRGGGKKAAIKCDISALYVMTIKGCECLIRRTQQDPASMPIFPTLCSRHW